MCTLIYTSGTTGKPKAGKIEKKSKFLLKTNLFLLNKVMVTHDNLNYQFRLFVATCPVGLSGQVGRKRKQKKRENLIQLLKGTSHVLSAIISRCCFIG